MIANMLKSSIKDDAQRAAHAADVLKALAHPVRLRIVAILSEQEAHVNGLAERLGLKQSIVSQQLRILRIHGLVQVSRASGYSFYSLAEPRLLEFIRCVEGCPFSS